MTQSHDDHKVYYAVTSTRRSSSDRSGGGDRRSSSTNAAAEVKAKAKLKANPLQFLPRNNRIDVRAVRRIFLSLSDAHEYISTDALGAYQVERVRMNKYVGFSRTFRVTFIDRHPTEHALHEGAPHPRGKWEYVTGNGAARYRYAMQLKSLSIVRNTDNN